MSPDGSEAGRYDLLPDVPFQCGESHRQSKRSPKHKSKARQAHGNKETVPQNLDNDYEFREHEATGFL